MPAFPRSTELLQVVPVFLFRFAISRTGRRDIVLYVIYYAFSLTNDLQMVNQMTTYRMLDEIGWG
jgi:hypothetical protein